MEDQYYLFNPGTNTSRCPIPPRFEHLLSFVDKIENYISLHSQEDIININSQLDQTTNLMISNIIQRVIAQIVGQTDKGFVTIKGSEDGAIHVSIQEDVLSQKNIYSAEIDFTGADTHDIIAATLMKKHKITDIVFTVGGETNITLKDEDGNFSGPMDFGGTDEPRGLVSNHGQIPLVCGTNKKFQMISSEDVQVSGYVLYYSEV